MGKPRLGGCNATAWLVGSHILADRGGTYWLMGGWNATVWLVGNHSLADGGLQLAGGMPRIGCHRSHISADRGVPSWSCRQLSWPIPLGFSAHQCLNQTSMQQKKGGELVQRGVRVWRHLATLQSFPHLTATLMTYLVPRLISQHRVKDFDRTAVNLRTHEPWASHKSKYATNW